MADFDDQLLSGAFADFRDEVAPHVKPAGTAAARETVRRRHRLRVITTTALAALAVAAPVVAYAASSGDPHGPPAVIGDSPSPTPSAEPGPTPSPSATKTAPAAPDGRIGQADLGKATLTIPAWPAGFADSCPTGTVKFAGGKAGEVGMAALRGDPAYVDVDRDGAQETVVLVACSAQGYDYQVLALDRDRAGKIVTLGKVIGSAGNTGKDGSDIMTIWGVEAGENGQVRVDVGEYRPCCESAQASQHQWRTYGWNGNRFAQTGGPTAFGPNPKVTDLVVTAGRLTMARQGDGSWAGTLRVTIHNAATFGTPGKLRFMLDVEAGWRAQPVRECRYTADESPLNCTLPSIGAGADRVLTVALTAPAGPLSNQGIAYVRAEDANDHVYPDRKSRGASATIQVVAG